MKTAWITLFIRVNMCLFNFRFKRLEDDHFICFTLERRNCGVDLLDWCSLVALVPPGLGWVEVATPQLPVKALGRQRIFFNLKCVVLDVIKWWGDYARSVFFNSLQDGFSPSNMERESHFTECLFWQAFSVTFVIMSVMYGALLKHQSHHFKMNPIY